jgi:lipopolysaccharide transport system permease protein
MSATAVDKKVQSEAPLTSPTPHDVESSDQELKGNVEWSNSTFSHLKELINHRELLQLVTERELKIRYKQTALGAVWAVLQPLSLMLVFGLFFSYFAGMKGDTGMPYALFSYTGLLAWTFFSTSMSFAIPSLITNSYIITKIYFPREIIPLSCVLAAFFDFLVASVIFIGLLIFYHDQVTINGNVLFVIPVMLIQLIFTIGMGFLLSAFTVLYRDVRYAMPLVIQIWMFATPILYPASRVRDKSEALYTAYMTLNPMAVIIDSYRKCVVQGLTPDLKLLGIATAISLFLLWGSYKYFKHLEREFADLV